MVLLPVLLICIFPAVVLPKPMPDLSKYMGANETMVEVQETSNGTLDNGKYFLEAYLDFASSADPATVVELCQDLESIGILDTRKIAQHIMNESSKILQTEGAENQLHLAAEIMSTVDCYIAAVKIVKRKTERMQQALLDTHVKSGLEEVKGKLSKEIMKTIAEYDSNIALGEEMKSQLKSIMFTLCKGLIEQSRNAIDTQDKQESNGLTKTSLETNRIF